LLEGDSVLLLLLLLLLLLVLLLCWLRLSAVSGEGRAVLSPSSSTS
jgi:hypothetical protein